MGSCQGLPALCLHGCPSSACTPCMCTRLSAARALCRVYATKHRFYISTLSTYMDYAWYPAQQAQQQVDQQLTATPIHHCYCHWGKQQCHDHRTTVRHCRCSQSSTRRATAWRFLQLLYKLIHLPRAEHLILGVPSDEIQNTTVRCCGTWELLLVKARTLLGRTLFDRTKVTHSDSSGLFSTVFI